MVVKKGMDTETSPGGSGQLASNAAWSAAEARAELVSGTSVKVNWLPVTHSRTLAPFSGGFLCFLVKPAHRYANWAQTSP